MSTSNPSQLFLLADHIKLSLLERQRAATLNLPSNSQDGQISRSLESLGSGIEALEGQNQDDSLRDTISRLQTQYRELSAQFDSKPDPKSPTSPTLNSPNNPSLKADFAAASTRPAKTPRSTSGATKSVRFTDADQEEDPEHTAARAALFPYRDNPDEEEGRAPDQSDMSNQQIHTYHSQVLRDQDDQLDALGASIGRQRELSMQIGDELDDQVLMLDDVGGHVDRHQGQLDRAKRRLGNFSRKAKDNWSVTLIVLLIIILVLLIIILK